MLKIAEIEIIIWIECVFFDLIIFGVLFGDSEASEYNELKQME